MTQEHRFLGALRRLQDWHLDSVKAQTFGGTAASAPGPRVLQGQSYPGTHAWLGRWGAAGSDEHREELIAAIEDEFYALGMAASRRSAASDGPARVFVGTLEHRRLVAASEGSVRQVARLWGISKSCVHRYRKEFA